MDISDLLFRSLMKMLAVLPFIIIVQSGFKIYQLMDDTEKNFSH